MGIHGYFVNLSKKKFVFIGKLLAAPHPKYSYVLSELVASEWKNDTIALETDGIDTKVYEEVAAAHYSRECLNDYEKSIFDCSCCEKYYPEEISGYEENWIGLNYAQIRRYLLEDDEFWKELVASDIRKEYDIQMKNNEDSISKQIWSLSRNQDVGFKASLFLEVAAMIEEKSVNLTEELYSELSAFLLKIINQK